MAGMRQSVRVRYSIPRRLGLLAVPLVLSASLAACGSGGGTAGGGGGQSSGPARPSVGQLVAALQAESSKMTPKVANCLATNMESSSLSDTALQAIIKDDNNYAPDSADKAAIKSVEPKLIQCLASELTGSEASALASASAPDLP